MVLTENGFVHQRYTCMCTAVISFVFTVNSQINKGNRPTTNRPRPVESEMVLSGITAFFGLLAGKQHLIQDPNVDLREWCGCSRRHKTTVITAVNQDNTNYYIKLKYLHYTLQHFLKRKKKSFL